MPATLARDFQIVLAQLEAFKRRLYLNLLLRGALLGGGLLLTCFLLFTLLEYFLYLPYWGRATLLFGFLGAAVAAFVRWLWAPLAGFLHLRRLLTDEQAARRVGDYYPEIQDKLLNALQLYHASGRDELMMASLDQRAAQLAPFHFPERVKMTENKPLVKYLAVPLGVVLLILLVYPAIFVEGSERIIHYRQHYAPKAPFDFLVRNRKLQVFRGEDFELQVAVKGRSVPEQLTIHYLDVAQPLARKGSGLFGFTFRGVQQSIRFRLEGAGFQSPEYELKVFQRPDLLDFAVRVEYPTYLRKSAETVRNTGNLTVPEGSVLTWTFRTEATDAVRLAFQTPEEQVTATAQAGTFSATHQATQTQEYTVELQNSLSKNRDAIYYLVTTIPDRFPDITLEHFADTVSYQYLLLGGNLADDYGFTALSLHYRVMPAGRGAQPGPWKVRALPFDRRTTSTTYSYEWNLGSLSLQPGDRLEYFTQVADNDGVHQPKTSRSRAAELRLPDARDLQRDLAATSQSVESQLSQSIQDAAKLQRELDRSEDKLKTKRDLSFQDKKGLENLVQKRQSMDQQVEDLKKKFDELTRKEDRFDERSQEIAQKSEALRKLMDDLLDPETKKLYEELQKLLQQQREDDPRLQSLLEKMENKEKTLERELERALEMFKQLQFDQKLEQTTQKLAELAQQQEKLGEQSEQAKDNKATSPEQQQLQEKQQDVKNAFEDVKKDLAGLEQLDKEMQDENGMDEQKDEQQQTDQNLQDAQQALSKAQNKKAGKAQKSAAQKMKQMADKLDQMQQEGEMESQEENLDALRDILENLLKLSFDQEAVMKQFRVVNQADPRFIQLGQQQLKLRDDAQLIEDSLYALANRVFAIKSFVTREVGEMNQHMQSATDRIRQRDLGRATGEQQFAMASMNNLALMLNDVLKQMQQQMQQQMQGQQAGAGSKPKKGKGNKPGSSPGSKPGQKPGQKPGPGNMGQLQQALNNRIQQLKQGGKQGRALSEELAQLAAQQEALRQALQELEKMQQGQPGSDGKPGQSPLGGGQGGELKKLMEQTESDLVNKRLSEQTLMRQQDILTRLLEVDKAVKERDWDDKRESKSGRDELARTLPPSFQKYLQRRRAQTQLLQSVSPSLTPYYQGRINQYFNSLNH